MRYIIETNEPDDLVLGIRAIKYCMNKGDDDSIMCYGEMNTDQERSFWVKKTKTGYSCRRLYRHSENSLST
jgi:hypothetical protein